MLQLFELRGDGTQDAEKKYREILAEYKIENYYYSCTYDLTNTLPRNMLVNSMPLFNVHSQSRTHSPFTNRPELLGICDLFQYNYDLVSEFHDALTCKKWVLAIIHGFAKHISTASPIRPQDERHHLQPGGDCSSQPSSRWHSIHQARHQRVGFCC
jgi:hypothetical protein